MKLQIPFYSSFATPEHPLGVHCVETCLKMILGYFEPSNSYSMKEIEKITGKNPEKGSWEFQWSIWFMNHGYEVKHYSEFDHKAFIKDGIEYIRHKYGDEVADFQQRTSDVEGARLLAKEYTKKAILVPRKPKIEDIRQEMKDGFVVKPMVNIKVLNDLDGYEGHSVVVLDVDDTDVWFHDPGLPAFESRKMSHTKFQQAMDSFGGEMDLVKRIK